jgi:beta-galactosidase/beta-glucuronidase
MLWQFSTTNGCWIGNSSKCSPNPHWVGEGRSSVAPEQAQPSFDDSAWEIVDLPHDFIISEAYDENDPASGHSYLPRNTSWYRKHFVLPADWQDSTIWIYFEGAFRYATVFFNGVQIGFHHCGYTSFSYRLDNVSGIKFGQQNLLAVFVDALSGSGWWYEGGG